MWNPPTPMLGLVLHVITSISVEFTRVSLGGHSLVVSEFIRQIDQFNVYVYKAICI